MLTDFKAACEELCVAIKEGDVAKATYLLDAHPDVVNRGQEYSLMESWLQMAVLYQQKEIVDLLICRGEDLYFHGEHEPPFFLAIRSKDPELIKLFLDHGIDTSRVANGVTPLARAVFSVGAVDLVQLLANRNPELLEEPFMDMSPLYIAARHGLTEAARVLLQAGADTGFVCNGMTPGEAARFYGNRETADLFDAFLAARNAQKLLGDLSKDSSMGVDISDFGLKPISFLL